MSDTRNRWIDRLLWAKIEMLAGAIVFWTPSLILHAVARQNFSGLHVFGLALVSPIVTVMSLKAIWLFRRKSISLQSLVGFMILGIWFFGLLFMSANATFTGGGFATQDVWRDLLQLMLIFPFTTFFVSAYDGSLLALLASNAALLLYAFRRKAMTEATA